MNSSPDRSAALRWERDLELLRQSARVSPPLREAVDRVEAELRRAREREEFYLGRIHRLAHDRYVAEEILHGD